MVREKVIGYAKEALKRGYAVEMIVQKLTKAGHDGEHIKGLVREAIEERIKDLSLQREALFGTPDARLDNSRRG